MTKFLAAAILALSLAACAPQPVMPWVPIGGHYAPHNAYYVAPPVVATYGRWR